MTDTWAQVVDICRQSMRDLIVTDPTPADHPARFSTPVLLELDHVVTAEADRVGRRLRIVDPFAGTGRVHKLAEAAHLTVGCELEPEWAVQGLPGLTWVGDSTRTPFPDSSFDAVCTSVTYPNRVTDHHNAADPCSRCKGAKVDPVPSHPGQLCAKCKGTGLSPRNTYRHKLGRMPSPRSTSVMGWTNAYRRMHGEAIVEWLRLLVGGGLVALNVSNHLVTVTKGAPQEEVRVVEWFCNELMVQGCNIVEARRVATRRNRNGANGDVRVDGETILVMRTPAKAVGTLLSSDNTGPYRRTDVVPVGGYL